MPQPAAPTRYTKRTLVTVSHAIEQAALAAAEDGPLVVIALFQRLPYFERERQVYERIAARAAVTVVGIVAGEAPPLPERAHAVLLADDEELAREWTVVVCTPRFGAVLVAHDREELDGGAATVESGRLFDGRCSYRRDEALHEALRLRALLADRLAPEAVAAIDAALDRVRDIPAAPGEARLDAAMRLLVERSSRDDRRLNDRRPSNKELAGPDSVGRYVGAAGVTASGVLPVALLAVHVAPVQGAGDAMGRTAARQEESAIGLLTARLRPADRATRVAPGEYLLYLPALAREEALSLAYRLNADFAEAAQHSAFLPVTATVVVCVSRRRPLPVDEVRAGLRWAVESGVPVATVDG